MRRFKYTSPSGYEATLEVPDGFDEPALLQVPLHPHHGPGYVEFEDPVELVTVTEVVELPELPEPSGPYDRPSIPPYPTSGG